MLSLPYCATTNAFISVHFHLRRRARRLPGFPARPGPAVAMPRPRVRGPGSPGREAPHPRPCDRRVQCRLRPVGHHDGARHVHAAASPRTRPPTIASSCAVHARGHIARAGNLARRPWNEGRSASAPRTRSVSIHEGWTSPTVMPRWATS